MSNSEPRNDDADLGHVIQEATTLLTRFVVPLYITHRGQPSLHGCGFFVRRGNEHFLVSAAHVLEVARKTHLFFYVSPGVTQTLQGRVLLSDYDGPREKDPIDVGVLPMRGYPVPPYPAVDKYAVDIAHLRPNYIPRSGKRYTFIGFPATKNKASGSTKEVVAAPYAYESPVLSEDGYRSLGVSPKHHLVLPFEQRVGFDLNGRQTTFPKPQGMSGGPIWVLLEEATFDTATFPLVGIGTKHFKRQKVMVGTDVAFALAMINAA